MTLRSPRRARLRGGIAAAEMDQGRGGLEQVPVEQVASCPTIAAKRLLESSRKIHFSSSSRSSSSAWILALRASASAFSVSARSLRRRAPAG